MSVKTSPARKTYFGITALVIAIISDLFLGANFAVANLKITPGAFSLLNNLTASLFCILTPLAFILGVAGHLRKNDSKTLARFAIALVTVPFLIIFAQLVYSFIH